MYGVVYKQVTRDSLLCSNYESLAGNFINSSSLPLDHCYEPKSANLVFLTC